VRRPEVAARRSRAGSRGHDGGTVTGLRVAALLALAALVVGGGSGASRLARAQAPACEQLVLRDEYVRSVNAALRAKRDRWGNRLLARRAGPTYQSVRGFLKPLLLVGRPAGRVGTRLTDSGVHYMPMGEPGGRSFADAGPAEPFALHVADGSQLVSRQANGRSATFFVGADGDERYGSCFSRLAAPRLAEGFLPVLTVSYMDAEGVRYRQEALVARDPRSGVLASFVRLEARSASSGRDSTQIRVDVSDPALAAGGRELRSDGRVVLAFSGGGTFAQDAGLRYRLDLADGEPDVLYLVRPIDPATARLRADASTFAAARSGAIAAWKRRLAEGAAIEVPEPLVMDALRNLLIQNLQLAWRYSLGNAYEAFYQPESSAAVLRLAEYGFLRDARQALESLLPWSRGRSTNWEQGEKLAAGAAYYLLSGDRAFLRRNTPTYSGYARDFSSRRAASANGLLDRQRYSGDITARVYGLHHQSRAWRGLRDMAYVWGLVGRKDLATRYQAEARAFASALRTAIARSTTRVSPHETFVPIDLLATPREKPWDPVTATRLGSYWNVVAPYAWASGIFPRESQLARKVFEYAGRRGSFLLGLVRFNYYPTRVGKVRCDGLPGLKTPGFENVYGVHRVHFLADFDRPDLLALTLYAKLAHGMARGTFVAGEGETIGPVPPGACQGQPHGEYYRSMYLPPSSANNDLFLATLRELLVHWYAREDGRLDGLQLAHATPRAWLAHGNRVAVRRLPTPFGRLGYTIDSRVDAGYLDVELSVPRRRPIGELRLRIRVPRSKRVLSARIGQATITPEGETFDLTGRTGRVHLRVFVRERP
jgi:hypothetical protein